MGSRRGIFSIVLALAAVSALAWHLELWLVVVAMAAAAITLA